MRSCTPGQRDRSARVAQQAQRFLTVLTQFRVQQQMQVQHEQKQPQQPPFPALDASDGAQPPQIAVGERPPLADIADSFGEASRHRRPMYWWDLKRGEEPAAVRPQTESIYNV